MKNDILYPVVMSKEDGGYFAQCYDYEEIYAEGDTIEEALKNIKEVFGLIFYDFEEDEYKKASNIEDIMKELKEGEFVVYVNVWLPYEFSKVKVVNTKKTLTIPNHLNMLGQYKNINFSKILTEALEKELNVK